MRARPTGGLCSKPEETSTHAVSPGRFSGSAETGTLRELELELVPCGLLSENTDR